jgi:hypothetical protein
MDAGDLARWTRFAAKGGIGKCTATQDCVAERAEDLMFLKVRSRLLRFVLVSLNLNETRTTKLRCLCNWLSRMACTWLVP